MSDFLLTDIKDKLEEAKNWLKEALWAMESYGGDAPEEQIAAFLKEFFRRNPEMSTLYLRMQELQKEIDALWTPALKAQLKKEQDEQSRLEDLADASSY